MSDRGPWIETFTGKKFHILDPVSEEICVEDIAHSLSNQCRFTGHVRRFYSVGEHCWWASKLVPKEDALWALLHDASESYLSDLSRPVKYHTGIGPIYREVEGKIQNAIVKTFGLLGSQPLSVTEADHILLYTEKDQLMPGTPWLAENEQVGGEPEKYVGKEANVKLVGYTPNVMEKLFLQRFYELT